MVAALADAGITDPFPIQELSLPMALSGADLIGQARTGTGKTLAFGIPLVQRVDPNAGYIQALVVVPTRELCLQVHDDLVIAGATRNVKVVAAYGGRAIDPQSEAIAAGAPIVVGTPGRLLDLVRRGKLDLARASMLVLDEADEMLDMGFREDLEEILDAAPDGRRTLLFSATLPKPIVALARRYQRDALRISTLGEERGHGDIHYQAVTVSPAGIEHAVVNLLRFHEAETALLFCATRDNVRHLHASLIERGFAAVALSGEHSQSERNHALQAMRDRRVRVCVATDVAARGIDLPTLSLVMHVELPRDAETLQHRSGRTGRAGKKGTAILIVPYQRRRRVESMLRGARIEAEWIPAPTADEVHGRDRQRLIETLLAPVEHDEEDVRLGRQLMEKMDPVDIAAALVRAHRARLPAPEDLAEQGEGRDRPERQANIREGFDDAIWFRINVGRRHNADPRWLLPLLCRRGHVTKNEVGAIRIGPAETGFAIASAAAGRFVKALARTAGAEDDGILIEPMQGGPREAARENRRAPPRHGGPPKKPYRSAQRRPA